MRLYCMLVVDVAENLLFFSGFVVRARLVWFEVILSLCLVGLEACLSFWKGWKENSEWGFVLVLRVSANAFSSGDHHLVVVGGLVGLENHPVVVGGLGNIKAREILLHLTIGQDGDSRVASAGQLSLALTIPVPVRMEPGLEFEDFGLEGVALGLDRLKSIRCVLRKDGKIFDLFAQKRRYFVTLDFAHDGRRHLKSMGVHLLKDLYTRREGWFYWGVNWRQMGYSRSGRVFQHRREVRAVREVSRVVRKVFRV